MTGGQGEMFGWLKTLFLDEKARRALEAGAAPAKRPAKAAPPSKAVIPARVAAKAPARPVDPAAAAARAAVGERAKLLRQAMEVHRAKQTILDHLSDEDRAKLLTMAILTFMNEGSESDPKTPRT